jgi:hypothetical protein
MTGPERSRSGFEFRLTLRQRRLRVLTAVVLVTIGAMVGLGMTHPFFRSAGSPEVRSLAREAVIARRYGMKPRPEAERARRAAAVRIAFIGVYWSVCLLLSGLLLILAWLDVREIRRKLAEARSTIAGPGPPQDGTTGCGAREP